MSQEYTFHVEMTCEGCVNAVKRVLDRSIAEGKGVESYKVDLAMKLVTIRGTLNAAGMTDVISKCGKDVSLKQGPEDL